MRRLVGDDLGSPGFGLRRRRRLRRVVWDSRERRVVVVGVGEVGGAQEAAGQSLGLWASGARPWEKLAAKKHGGGWVRGEEDGVVGFGWA